MHTATCLPISPDAEAGVFLRLRGRITWHTLRGMLADSRLRVSLVVVLSVVFWGALYGLFYEGFGFLDSIHAEVISLLFNAFFSSLMVMLVFSTGILLYGSLYCSSEAKLLLTLPVRAEAIVTHKFREALWFSSWGFVLLGSPMLVAYGVVRGAPWTFYLLLMPFLLAFVLIPATLGAILCIALVAWAARLRVHAFSAAAVTVVAAAVWLGWSIVPTLFEGTYAPITSNLAVLFCLWLMVWWMPRFCRSTKSAFGQLSTMCKAGWTTSRAKWPGRWILWNRPRPPRARACRTSARLPRLLPWGIKTSALAAPGATHTPSWSPGWLTLPNGYPRLLRQHRTINTLF
jgi:hypothetical protein